MRSVSWPSTPRTIPGQGLVFVAFNQDIARQFATILARPIEEPMIDHINPVGGGYSFAPPGARGPADWVWSGLIA
jgi:deferrochelatase/peroxidase EfeB